jgi:hypothetical protein
MRKLFVVAAAGIVVLGAVAFAIVAYSTRWTAGPTGAGSLATAAPPAATPPPPAAGVGGPFGTFAEGQSGPPAPGSWEAIPPVQRAVPAIASPVRKAVAHCFDPDAEARFGPRPHTTVPGVSEAASRAVPALMLHIEALDGAARIVDAPMMARGTASDALLACAQEALRGKTIPAPPQSTRFEPGTRVRLPYALQPSPEQAAVVGVGAGTANPKFRRGSGEAAPPAPSTFRRQRGGRR